MYIVDQCILSEFDLFQQLNKAALLHHLLLVFSQGF